MAVSTRPMPSQEAPHAVATFSERVYSEWMALQVELHGKYSLERLRSLRAYSSRSSLVRVAWVSLLTPLPCFLLITLMECVQLQPTEAGIYKNYVFWARNALTVAFISFAVMEQLRTCLPRFSIPLSVMLTVTAFATIAGISQQFGLAQLVGFPLPFGILMGTPAWTIALGMCCLYLWGGLLRRDIQARNEFINYIAIFSCQMSLTFVYPAYIYIFNSLKPNEQTAFVVLLPILKLGTKNVLSYFLRNMDDIKPEFIIFNIEIFNSLYVTCCMQNASSKFTTVALMMTDFILAWMSVKDLNELYVDVRQLMDKIHTIRDHGELTIIDIALDIIENDSTVRNHPDLRVISAQSKANGTGTIQGDGAAVKQFFAGSRRIVPVGAETSVADDHSVKDTECLAASQTAPLVHKGMALDHRVIAPPKKTPQDQHRIALLLGALTEEERLLFVKKTARILFVTEFIILIEYTEVVTPLIYCLYTIMVFSLPNRAYYARLKDLPPERLHEIVANVLMYSGLELFSFLCISWILHSRFRLSALRQLAFVLETQWTMVQSKLILWTFYVVQSSLDHFGVDFSLQFAWLNKSN